MHCPPRIPTAVCLSFEGASIPENALGPRTAVRSIVTACVGPGTVNHEQLLHGWLYRDGMGGGASSGFLNGGHRNGYLTTSVA